MLASGGYFFRLKAGSADLYQSLVAKLSDLSMKLSQIRAVRQNVYQKLFSRPEDGMKFELIDQNLDHVFGIYGFRRVHFSM